LTGEESLLDARRRQEESTQRRIGLRDGQRQGVLPSHNAAQQLHSLFENGAYETLNERRRLMRLVRFCCLTVVAMARALMRTDGMEGVFEELAKPGECIFCV